MTGGIVQHHNEFGIGTFEVDPFGRFDVPASVQADCAAEVGLSESEWKDIESDQRAVSVSELVAIAAMFHVDPGYLLAPPGDLLHEDTGIRCGDYDGAKVASAEEWLLWIRGVAPLPSQNADRYFTNMATATVYVEAPYNSKQQPKADAETDISHWEEVVRRRFGRANPAFSGQPVDASKPESREHVTASGELLSAFVVLRDLLAVERGHAATDDTFSRHWKGLQTHLIRLWQALHGLRDETEGQLGT